MGNWDMKLKEYIRKKFIKIEIEKVIIPCMEGNILNGRTALITGASSGIGYSIANSFVKNGAKVILCGRNVEKLKKAKLNLILENKCEDSYIDILEIDLNSIEEMKKNLQLIFENTIIDIFVNNAGINGGKLFPNTSENEYERILSTNLKGTYFISQEIVKYMVKNNIQGNILNITSSSSLRPGISPYILSKWGERSLTLGMAKKYLPYGIIVNGLAPGTTLTSMTSKNENNNLFCEYSPSKRYAAPEEIGNLATILVSSMGKMIVGDTIYATGGAGLITYDDTTY